ncbi:hypothetical protein Vadar_009667 [Vaccinium darrowii]|uniref:Uncharacterized protein n=1 Tax=Vaccinium darrowii TaxID=229202 RepID=A0ACB7YW40_9ERIC|nr:hypothetical protein Vadar_009667 [Vaccinium darrowii]
MVFTHFSHDHPLIFEEDYKDDDVEVSCYGCQQLISGPCYYCGECKRFVLHKVCAELPKEMKHPAHPEHQLYLLPSPPDYPQSRYSKSPCECGGCRQPCESFTYNCSLCKFDIDIMCALMVHKIEHECHHHPLTPLQWPSLFLCNACGTRHEGTSFKCSTCKFWVNQKCASLPRTMRVGDHDHLLSLTYSFPYERFKFRSYCKVCYKEIKRVNWAYCCADCKYFVHLNCLTSKPELGSFQITQIYGKGKSIIEYMEPNLFLTWPDESTSLMAHFVKAIGLHMEEIGLQEKSEKLTKVYHVGHHHPVFLVDKEIDDESSAGRKLIACNGCAQPVSAPFYHCSKCNFILHDCCAEIPVKLEHLIHPDHPLLLNRWPSKCSGLLICQVCYRSCNGVSYGCVECDFFLHLDCASLLFLIRKSACSKHEAHPHALKWKYDFVFCSACNQSFEGHGLACYICNFGLHHRCALLPQTLPNKYDRRHLFSLLYFGKDEEYYCEICEEEIDPNCWFYDCGDCRRSLHTNCIWPLPQHSITHESHSHPLALREGCFGGCAACKHDCYGFGFVCEENCDFSLHTRCASLPLTVAHRYDEHPLILIYSGNLVETVCQICEAKVDRNCWFYNCAKCKKNFHPLCVQFVEKSELRIGVKVSLGGHQHLPSFVEYPKDINPCNSCGELVKDECFECADYGLIKPQFSAAEQIRLSKITAVGQHLFLLFETKSRIWDSAKKANSAMSTGRDMRRDDCDFAALFGALSCGVCIIIVMAARKTTFKGYKDLPRVSFRSLVIYCLAWKKSAASRLLSASEKSPTF